MKALPYCIRTLLFAGIASLLGFAASSGRGADAVGIPSDARQFRGNWYLLYFEPLSWDAAERRCEALGGQLAVVPDKPTWQFIVSLQKNKSALWMGGTDEGSKGNWRWVDGTPFNFNLWFNRYTSTEHGPNDNYLCLDNAWAVAPWRAARIDGSVGKNHVGGFICEWKSGAHPASVPRGPATNSQPRPESVAIQTDANRSRIDILKEQAPNAVEWALAPLDQAAPGNIRQNLTFLREDLLDEGKEKPKASAAAYALGSQICNTILAAFEERNQARARAGFRAVEASASTGVTSEALEARRNYKMSWPQFAREESQRAELKSQAEGNAQVMAEKPKLEWTQRTTAYRKTLDALYSQFRDALRQGDGAK